MRPHCSCASLTIADLLDSALGISGSSLTAIVEQKGRYIVCQSSPFGLGVAADRKLTQFRPLC